MVTKLFEKWSQKIFLLAADGIRFKPFNSWIPNPSSAIALALHTLTSALIIDYHTKLE